MSRTPNWCRKSASPGDDLNGEVLKVVLDYKIKQQFKNQYGLSFFIKKKEQIFGKIKTEIKKLKIQLSWLFNIF